MRKVLTATVAGLTLAFGLALISAPASAGPTTDCRVSVVNLIDRRDNGNDGNQWAKDTMTRTLKVCVEAAAPAEVKATEDRVLYRATVVDNGTFVTVSGKSPNKLEPLAQGITGTVKGGFRMAVFAAPMWEPSYVLTNPGQTTPSGEWLKTAMPTAEGTPAMTTYNWSYVTACQSYTDSNGTPTGDITATCVTAKAPMVTKATCDAPGELVIPTVVGVKYKSGLKENGKVKVTATAEPGYKLTGETKWTLAIPEKLPADSAACKPATTPPGGGGGVVTPSPSQSTTVPGETPEPTMSPVAGSDLPVTGGKGNPVLFFTAISGLLLSAGAILLLAARRRKVA